MKTWRMRISLPTKEYKITLDEIFIERGSFQGDSFSPLLFCIALAPLSRILQRAKVGFKSDSKTISHLLYMDDLKVFYIGNTPSWTRRLLQISWYFPVIENGFLHPKSNIHRLYSSRTDGGRGICSTYDCYQQEFSSVAKYMEQATTDPLTELIKTTEDTKPRH